MMIASQLRRAWVAGAFPFLLAGVLLGVGCGRDDEANERAVIPFGVRSEGAPDECNTVVLLALDGVMQSDLADLTHLPNIARLAASSVSFATAITPQTSGNGALASVLTGLHSREHGVFSVKDPGRSSLPGALVTLPERFLEAGWRTAAALPSKRHDRRISGFAQGFEAYEAPRVGQPDWSAEIVVLHVRDVVAELGDNVLEDPNSSVFLLAGMQDVIDRAGDLPDASVLAPLAAEALDSYRAENARIDAALTLMSTDAVLGLGKLKTTFARARGSGAAAAWYGAVRDARMVAIDAAVGDLLAILEETGRADRALVVLTSLRGDGDAVARPEAGPSFAPEIIEVPLLIHRCGSGEQRSEGGVRSLVDLARAIGRVAGIDVPESDFAGTPLFESVTDAETSAFVSDARSSVHAMRTSAFHIERHPGPEVVWFGPKGRNPLPLDEIERLANTVATQSRLGVFSAQDELIIERATGAPGIEIAWSLSRGFALGKGSARARRVRGTSTLEERFVLPVSERSASIKLRVDGSPPSGVFFGPRRLDRLPVRYVPAEDAPSVEDEAVPTLEFVRAPGRAWTLAVRGEGEATVTVGTWPPRTPTDGIEVQTSTAAFEFVLGRPDLVRFTGTLPIDVLLKRRGSEEFTVACERAGVFLSPVEMASDGSWFSGPEAFECVIPSIEPGVTPTLYTPLSPPPPEGIRVSRKGLGFRRERPVALDSTALEYLRFLPAGE